MRKLSSIVACALVLCATESSAVGVVDPDANVAGKSIAEWGFDWWQWVWNQSPDNNAFGEFGSPPNGAAGQSGPVWFLAGTFGNPLNDPVERKIHIPTDTYVLFPMLNTTSFNDIDPPQDFTDEFLQMSVESNLQGAAPFALIDDAPVQDIVGRPILDFLGVSEASDYVFGPDNLFGLPEGVTRGVAGGYWVMLEPFGPNETRNLLFGGENATGFTTSVSAVVTTPVPASIVLLAVGLVGLGVATRRKRGA